MSKIFKNTLVLYLRLLLILAVSLFTSKVLLQNLGIENYGIYNVVAGTVYALSFFLSGLSNAIQRFLSLALVGSSVEKKRLSFSQSLLVLVGFAILLLLLGGGIGWWIVGDILNIPPDKRIVSLWLLLTNIGIFACAIIQIAFQSMIILHERMEAYAYLSIVEVILKLLTAYLIVYVSGDKLIIYGVLLFISYLIILGGYVIYCRQFEECRFRWVWNPIEVRSICSFVGFNAFGGFTVATAFQGNNMLLNLFFGPVVNAARGISSQVIAALNLLAENIMTAAKPQLLKHTINQEFDRAFDLTYTVSKAAYFAVLLVSLPVFLNTEYILRVWLIEFPSDTVLFVRILILQSLFVSLIQPLWIIANGTGKIKSIQIYGRMITLSSVVISYWLLKGFSYSWIPLAITVITDFFYWIYNLCDIHKQVSLPYSIYFNEVIKPILEVSLIVLIIVVSICCLLNDLTHRFWLGTPLVFILGVVLIYFVGLKEQERLFVRDIIKKQLRKCV